jgi:hypothetical protein
MVVAREETRPYPLTSALCRATRLGQPVTKGPTAPHKS